jgi:MscS family membrane protein
MLLPIFGMAQGFDNPHDVVYNHLHNLEPDNRFPEVSAISFHPEFSLERRVEMAENLKRVLDARGLYIHVSNIPKNGNYKDSLSGNQVYAMVSNLPQVTVEKYGNKWYYSKSLEKDIPKLFRSTFPSWSLTFINDIPESLKVRVFSISLWKVIGLFLILLFSYVLFKIFEKIVDKLMEVSIWKRLKLEDMHLHLLHKLARYFGISFFLILIKYLLPLLMLEIRVSSPLFKIINILITYFLMVAVLKMVDIGKEYVQQLATTTESKTDDQLIPILSKSLKVFLVILGIVRILYLLNVNVTALIAGLSIGGLALALAAQDTVKNLIGSAMIFFDKPFQVGDYIVAMDFEGTVEEVGFRSSRVRKIDTSLITVPNGNLTNATMINYGIRRFRLFETNLGFTYDSDPKNLKSFVEDLKQYLAQFDQIQAENYYVTLRHLSASSIDIFFRVFIDAQTFKDELVIREDLIYTVMEKAKNHNLSFAFPSTSVYVEQLPKTS